MDPKRVESYNQIKMCMCVDVSWIYLVANLILLCSLKTYLSFQSWKHFCKRTGAILFIFFFFLGGHLSTHYFQYISDTYPFFNSFCPFFMNYFCIAPCLFSATKLWERYQQELWSICFEWMENLSNMFLYSLPV